MKTITPLLGLLALILLLAPPASAFDGRRQGFVLGGGLGLGGNSFDQELKENGAVIGSGSETKAALATDFRIGGGLSETFLLYYDNRVTWFSLENALGEDVTISSGISGVGGTWYPNPQKQLFLEGTVGVAIWDTPFEDGSEASTGFGSALGVGYEFQPHWSISGTVIFTTTNDEEGIYELVTDTFAYVVTVNGLAF